MSTAPRSIVPEDDAPQASGVRARPRSHTGRLMAAAGRGAVPTWLAMVIGLASVGGGGILSATFVQGEGSKAMAGVDRLERDFERDQLEQEKRNGQQNERIAAIESAQRDAELRMWRSQVRTLRWIADVLAKQSKALGKLAEAEGVEVDVEIPPLLVDDMLDASGPP